MQSDPWKNPKPDVRRPLTFAFPWWFVVAGLVFLVVLAPLVPDEPMHLSGVMVVLGLASAALALLSGIALALRSEGDERRSAGLAAVGGFVLVLAWLGWWFVELMSQLS